MNSIDLNADVGEGMDDGAILPFLTSVNVACGLHAGGPEIMDRTVTLALERGLCVGAHPGYDDRANFGRVAVELSPAAAASLVLFQIGALEVFVRAHGGRLVHVKAHGALYNRAARDPVLARAVCEGVRKARADLVVVGLAGSRLIDAAIASGLPTAREAFADRRYLADGSLMPRKEKGSVLTDPDEAAEQALHIARDGYVITSTGTRLDVEAQTLCLHGDTPGAPLIARAVRERLEAAQVRVVPLRS
ncbi:MAG: 5-oxoprolinase subunit PxpA [Myxococcales bacterium]